MVVLVEGGQFPMSEVPLYAGQNLSATGRFPRRGTCPPLWGLFVFVYFFDFVRVWVWRVWCGVCVVGCEVLGCKVPGVRYAASGPGFRVLGSGIGVPGSMLWV